MKRFFALLAACCLALAASLSGTSLHAQTVTNGSYSTIGHIKSDGTIQDGSYRTIGHIKSDGLQRLPRCRRNLKDLTNRLQTKRADCVYRH